MIVRIKYPQISPQTLDESRQYACATLDTKFPKVKSSLTAKWLRQRLQSAPIDSVCHDHRPLRVLDDHTLFQLLCRTNCLWLPSIFTCMWRASRVPGQVSRAFERTEQVEVTVCLTQTVCQSMNAHVGSVCLNLASVNSKHYWTAII